MLGSGWRSIVSQDQLIALSKYIWAYTYPSVKWSVFSKNGW